MTGRGELLLELLSEEIPAGMQRRAISELKTHLGEWLQAHRILGAGSIDGYVTPRRLTVIVQGIPERLPPSKEERRGPRVGSPQQAIEGFLRSAGITSVEQCEVRATGRGDFYFAVIERPGQATADVLPDLIYSTVSDVAWPKSMRYPASSVRWVRPLNSVICLLNGTVLSLPLGDVPVGRITQGHRFLSNGKISVDSADDYLAKLERAYVVLDPVKRRQIIADGLEGLAKAEGLKVKDDPQLLDEVTGLVEFPVVLAGAIDPRYMGLPPEVLATAMRMHQKYFSCLKADSTPAPRFLFVSNNIASDGGRAIIAGNERVLRARLADARFFWDHDRRIRLENRVEALKDRVYHEKLGSLFDKVERIEELAEFLVGYVPRAGEVLARRTARLAKSDLSTGMVAEFPELQGIVGRYYALGDHEDPRVAEGIAEHYKPHGPNDTCPTTPEGIVVALCDKLDALFAFFWINEKPSGSRDPFGLRRAAQGIIRIILENQLRLPLAEAFKKVHEIFTNHQKESLLANSTARYPGVGPFVSDITDELLAFVGDRLIAHLREKGIRHDYIAAAFTQISADNGDLVRLLQRVEAVRGFLNTDDGANLLIAYRRAVNIVAIEERRDKRRYDRNVEMGLLREPEEFALASNLELASRGAERLLARGEFNAAMGHLAILRRPVDDFFDKVTVNCDDAALRENRLRLLSRTRDTMNQIADFSQIEG